MALANAATVLAGPAALHVGDSVTLADLFGYLAPLPQPGDWVEVRNTGGGVSTVVTTGFGEESVSGNPTLWIETCVESQPVTGLSSMQAGDIAPPVVLKTYVSGTSFGPFGMEYNVIASVASIGDKAFRLSDTLPGYPTLASGAPPTYSLADGTPFAHTLGTVMVSEPKDLDVGGTTVHATHLIVAFQGQTIAEGASVPPTAVEVWQTPDVPFGTVESRAHFLGVDRESALVGYGWGDYRSQITTTLDALRGQTTGQ